MRRFSSNLTRQMPVRDPSQTTRSETLRSPALYLGALDVQESQRSHGGRWLSGTRLKSLAIPALHWSLRHLPVAVAMVQVRLIVILLRLMYWRRWPLRLACERLCRLAAARGYRHQPKQVYHQYLSNFTGVAENYFRLYRDGLDAVLERVDVPAEGVQALHALLATHGGVVLAVPHNIASAFSGLALNHAFPLVVVAKNSSTIARTRVALDMFERMRVQVLMVRGGNTFELSRALFRILGSGRVAAATLDNIDGSDAACTVRLFGQSVTLANWAAKVAARRGIPVVPAYFGSRGARIGVCFGEPLLAGDVNALVRHYTAFFERQILRDPASWAYLGDKRWQRLLERAAGALEPGGG
jgi:lauroyl/myristoyl acyltransferase